MVPTVAVTIEDLKAFHSIDREVYSRLVFDLNVDLFQAMEMISLWLWLEEIGYANLIMKMGGLPSDALKALAEEALACLRVVAANAPPPPHSRRFTDLPLTHSLLEGEFIDLDYFDQNRETATYKIHKMVDGICRRVFDDIVQHVLSFSSIPDYNMMMPNPDANITGPGFGPHPAGFGGFRPNPSGFDPANQHARFNPIVFGITTMQPTDANSTGVYHGGSGVSTFETGESSTAQPMFNPRAAPYNRTSNVISSDELAGGREVIPADDRTLFVMFSRGFPVSENDVHEYFARKWGDCVEEIVMQNVPEYRQPLSARVVLYSQSKMNEILEGKDRLKLTIRGRQIIVRRYNHRNL